MEKLEKCFNCNRDEYAVSKLGKEDLNGNFNYICMECAVIKFISFYGFNNVKNSFAMYVDFIKMKGDIAIMEGERRYENEQLSS